MRGSLGGRRDGACPVRRGAVGRAKVLALVCGLKDLKTAHKCLVHGHHCTTVIELAAVVWRTKQRDKLTTLEELVAVLDDLVSSAN